MHAFDVLGDPVRRRILELLAAGEQTSGAITEVIRAEFGITQPAVSQHLRVLREAGFATVRPEGARRLYAVNPEPLRDVDAWLDPFRAFWTPHLDALATEIARGRRQRRLRATPTRGAAHDRRRPPDQQRRAPSRQPDAGRRRGAHADDLARVRHAARGPVGRLHQPRADPALVPAGLGRPAPGRPLRVRGQRVGDDRALRAARTARRDVGVRRPGLLDRAAPHRRARRPHALRARAHRPRRGRALGPVRPGRRRRRLGPGRHGPQPAPRRRRRPVDREAVEAWQASDEGREFTRLSSDGWAEASIAAGTDADEARAAAARTTDFYTPPA